MSNALSVFDQQMAALDDRIEAGIREHRMRDVILEVTGPDGHPVANCDVSVEQVASRFLFGANLFMLDGYDSAALNERYEQRFVQLFNSASVPLYWKGLEPTQGAPRFTADSEPVYRRPPPDVVVDFCQQHGLNMNGHCLVWDHGKHSIPDWLPDATSCESLLERRIRELGERYGDCIQRWDVLNEALSRPALGHRTGPRPMPHDIEFLAFQLAQRYLPSSAHLMINETTAVAWLEDYRHHYHELIRSLRRRGAKIDGIGLQWHLFSLENQQRLLDGAWLTPASMLAALDEYAAHERPLHISEITLHSARDDAIGRKTQARLARHVYRLWFSHPAVHAITWWNVPDGGAVPGEDHLPSGLLDEQLDPKAAYEALDQLINHEWRTRTTVTTDDRGRATFRGFLGRYRFRIKGAQQSADVGAGASPVVALSVQ